jgi:hypothetical protein
MPCAVRPAPEWSCTCDKWKIRLKSETHSSFTKRRSIKGPGVCVVPQRALHKLSLICVVAQLCRAMCMRETPGARIAERTVLNVLLRTTHCSFDIPSCPLRMLVARIAAAQQRVEVRRVFQQGSAPATVWKFEVSRMSTRLAQCKRAPGTSHRRDDSVRSPRATYCSQTTFHRNCRKAGKRRYPRGLTWPHGRNNLPLRVFRARCRSIRMIRHKFDQIYNFMWTQRAPTRAPKF